MMDNLTVIVPFFNGYPTLGRLLDSLPLDMPVLIVDDQSDIRLHGSDFGPPKPTVIRSPEKGYFTGAVNAGLSFSTGDVVIVNQDAWFTGDGWLEVLAQHRERYGLIGEQPVGNRPSFPGYIHGSFMFIRRDVFNKIGPMNANLYPMWGSVGEYQLRACRAGFEVLPIQNVPDFQHRPERPGKYGLAMSQLLNREPERESDFTRIPPEISVVIPCHNYGRYLPEAIESLLAQTFQSFEVIIVNDASTDDSLEIAQSLADPWKAIRVVHLKDRLGTAGAMNAGIKQANGKYIARLDADDMMRPHRLGEFFELQLKHPHSFIFDDLILFGSETLKYGGLAKNGDDYIFPLPTYDFEYSLYHNGVHAGIMFPKQAWLDTGGYPVEFADGREDWAFNLALGIKGYCGIKADKPGYMYRRDGQNRTLENTSSTKNKMFQEKLIRFYPDIYRGVRPMGCCGSGKQITKNGNTIVMASNSNLPGRNGFEILEYVGPSSADMTWWGPATKTRYVFGGNRRVGYVDAADAPGMLQMSDGGKKVFAVYAKPQTVEQPVEIVTVDEMPVVIESVEQDVPPKRGVKRK